MWVYLYPNNTETEISNGYIGIPDPESITLNRSSLSLSTTWNTFQLVATIEPLISDKTVTWTSDDTTIATVDSTGLVTCITPWDCTITATTVNGLTATCLITSLSVCKYLRWRITSTRWNPWVTQMSEFELWDNNWNQINWNTYWASIVSDPAWVSSSEWAEQLIDGSVYTKCCVVNNPPVIETITFQTNVDFSVYNTYKWYTANDFPERDPISWAIEVSNDGINWIEVDVVTNANITTSRQTLAFTWTITV